MATSKMLNSTEVLSIKKVGGGTYSKGPNMGQHYNVYSYQGVGFTESEEFEKLRSSGAIARLELTESSYEREVTAEDGSVTTETRRSWVAGSPISFNQLKGVTRGEAELAAISKEFDLADALATV